MYTVNEIMNLSLFKKFKILTGKEYLTNTVTTTVILEFEKKSDSEKSFGNCN